MRQVHPRIEALGAAVLAVGTGADYQARRLMELGSPFPCLVDPDKLLYQALGLGRLGPGHLLKKQTYMAYWRGFRRGARQGKITGDPRQLSGVALLDDQGGLIRLHRSTTVGDYPPVAELVRWVEEVAGTS
ncbi:MAG: AhpC/TSA family protein [Acidimicrobiia bacterium]